MFPAGFIGLGFLLYLLNIMGAGDSKFLAGLFLIVPQKFHAIYFEKIVITTIISGFFLLFLKLIHNRFILRAYLLSGYWIGIFDLVKSRFSYAPVIATAWVLLGVDLWT
jgi:Flp pilus assembly protein protease CpaA